MSQSGPSSIAGSVYDILHNLGDDPDREGLLETPHRVAKALRFMCSGYECEDPGAILKTFEDGGQGYDEMVAQWNVGFHSLCEHHMLIFWGNAHIAYIPNGKVVGLSKLSRLVDVYARRLQTQERLTVLIADALMEHLKPLGCGVILDARHLCMEARGVQKTGVVTSTAALRGAFKTESEVRSEFESKYQAKANQSV
jgi:GTP cyclohydrolase I